MQRFPCPFCGPRDEREFRYVADAGKRRPDTSAPVSDAVWSEYLHAQKNLRGEATEIWVHLTCQEAFQMTRNTVTMDVLSSAALRKDRP